MSAPAPDGRVDAAVSYSRADRARVERLIEALERRGLAVWFDQDIPGGALWEEIIARKYRASKAVLFFVSRASLDSGRCSDEVSTARTLGKPIIPILLDPLKLPDDLPDRFVLTLQARNTVDAVDRPDGDVEAAIFSALAGFGISVASGAAQAAAPASAPVHAPLPVQAAAAPRPPERKRRTGALIAFGGFALAVLLVAVAYVVFVGGRQDRAVETAGRVDPSPASSKPPAHPPTPSADPDPASGGPAPSPGPAPPAGPPNVATGGVDLSLAQTSFVEGDAPVVRYEGFPGNKKDWIAVALADAPDGAYLTYLYTNGEKSGALTMARVMKPGRYEIRAYVDGEGNTPRARLAFEVAARPAPVLTLSKQSYREGEPIVARASGLLGSQWDWIAVAEAGSSPAAVLFYAYTKGGAEAEVKLRPVVKAGRYEARVYYDDKTGDKTVRAAVPFEVTPGAPVTVTPDAASYGPGAPMKIAFAGMPGNSKDWIAIAKAGAADSAYATYVYTLGETAGSVAMKAPSEPGDYELRAYFDDSTGDRVVRGRAAFKVAAP